MNNETTTMDNLSESYCVPGASDFREAYIKLHGYIALTICILGSIANIVNITVLSRKQMASNTNFILTGLAAADLLVMLEYIPFALHLYLPLGQLISSNTYAWAVFIYFHVIFSLTFHTISIWLTITLAVWRYASIKFPHRNKTWLTSRNTAKVIVGAYVICPFTCLPIVFSMQIDAVPPDKNGTEIAYVLQMSDNRSIVTTTFWIYSVLLKLIPCIVLSVFMACLISIMKSSEKNRRRLLQKNNLKSTNEEKTSLQDNSKKVVVVGRTDRTTRMLVALLGLFLITELPQGLFGLLSALAPHFFEKCYGMFGEVMDILALLSSAVNFVLYCSMSKQFRTTFGTLITDLLDTLRLREGSPNVKE